VLDNWRRTLAIGLAFVLAICGAFLFASRAQRGARLFHKTDEPIHGWMTIPFIAHTHHVPTTVLFQAIGVEQLRPHDHRSVRHLARELHRPVPQLIDQLQRAIDAASQPPGGAAR
jgi:hypothetical protein